MKTRITLIIAICAGSLMLTAQPSQAQVSKQASGYLFRLAFKKGQVMKYSIVVSTDNASKKEGGFKMNLPATMTVKDVVKGIATIESTVTAPQANAKPDVKTFKVDNRGNVKSGDMPMQSSGMFISYPEKAISVGAIWTSNASQGGINATMNYKFTGVKAVGGKQVAVIAITLVGKGQQNLTGNGSMLVNLADGMLIKMNNNMTIAAGGKPLKMSMVMSRTQ